jgi:hypothetical protein
MNSFETTLSDFLDNPRHFLVQITESGPLDCLTGQLQNYFIELIKESPRDVALEKILSIATEAQFSPAVQSSCEQAMLWLSAGMYDPIITPAIIEMSERSSFALSDHLEAFLPNDRAPFFLSAFMPKSGGTFISQVLKRECRYNTEIGIFVGSTSGDRYNYLLRAKLPIFRHFGGVFNHAHLDPNSWNQSAIRDSGLPFWLHLRDPRDSLLSAVNMIDKEHLRKDDVSGKYYQNLKQDFDGDMIIASLDQRAKSLIGGFEDYCAWISGWMAFAYDRKLVTYHQQLQADPEGLSALVNDRLGLKLAPDSFRISPNDDYKSSRFHIGTNGRWAKEFEPSLCDTLLDIMKRHRLDTIFPAEPLPPRATPPSRRGKKRSATPPKRPPLPKQIVRD